MRFKLPRQLMTQEAYAVISREVRKQKIKLLCANKKHLKQLYALSCSIVKEGIGKGLVRKKLQGGLGQGIFLHPRAKPILKGQIIASYAGRISFAPQNQPGDSSYAFEPLSKMILTKEEQAHFDPSRRYHPRRLYSMYVDALKEGNFTRFINHSEQPNLVAELFRIPPNCYGLDPSPIEVIYLAKKTIHPGEQLLVCYEGEDKSYWGSLKIKPVPITPKTFQLDSSLRVHCLKKSLKF